jgi:hypothetical protein
MIATIPVKLLRVRETGIGLDKEELDQSKAPPGLLIEDGVNMFIARTGFDLLRSPVFQTKVHAHIQKKLNDVRVPAFMDGMQVCSAPTTPLKEAVSSSCLDSLACLNCLVV